MGHDLTYAAKVMLMRAASMLLHQIEIHGSADHLLITVLHEICRIALRTGQIIDFLNYYYLRWLLSNVNPDFQDERLMQCVAEEQNILTVRLMGSDLSKAVYGNLPDILNRLELILPMDALYYKLGYHDEQSDEFTQLIKDDQKAIAKLREAISDEFFLYENYVAEETMEVETLVNGCRITARCNSDSLLHSCSELLLAFIESLCSTMGFKDFVFSTNNIHFDVIGIEEGKSEILSGKDSNHYVFNVNTYDIDDKKIWEVLCMFLALLFTRNAMSGDLMQLFEDKQSKEKLLDRLSVLMTYLSDFNNVVGDQYRANIGAWKQENDRYYAFQGADDLNQPFEYHRGKQANCIISSIIDYPLWDRAEWKGCGFFIDRLSIDKPVLFLCYMNIDAGIKIFEGWTELLKRKELNIRIAFILHVDKKHPSWYRVQVGQDIASLRELKQEKGRYVMQATRFHTMNAETSENIDTFRQEFERNHICLLSAVAINEKKEMAIYEKDRRYDNLIPLRNVVFREAWEVGINDMDNATILPDDDPIIPEEHLNDAPVLELLEKKRKIRG